MNLVKCISLVSLIMLLGCSGTKSANVSGQKNAVAIFSNLIDEYIFKGKNRGALRQYVLIDKIESNEIAQLDAIIKQASVESETEDLLYAEMNKKYVQIKRLRSYDHSTLYRLYCKILSSINTPKAIEKNLYLLNTKMLYDDGDIPEIPIIYYFTRSCFKNHHNFDTVKSNHIDLFMTDVVNMNDEEFQNKLKLLIIDIKKLKHEEAGI